MTEPLARSQLEFLVADKLRWLEIEGARAAPTSGDDVMGYWNYRVCRHPDGRYALHEVHYEGPDDPGSSWTAEPCDFAVDAEEGVAGLVASLEMALRDARDRPVFVIPELGGEELKP